MDGPHPAIAEAFAGKQPMPPATELECLRAERMNLAALYDRALLDPNARLPTYLHFALEALRK